MALQMHQNTARPTDQLSCLHCTPLSIHILRGVFNGYLWSTQRAHPELHECRIAPKSSQKVLVIGLIPFTSCTDPRLCRRCKWKLYRDVVVVTYGLFFYERKIIYYQRYTASRLLVLVYSVAL